jgi:hypothetical protein
MYVLTEQGRSQRRYTYPVRLRREKMKAKKYIV